MFQRYVADIGPRVLIASVLGVTFPYRVVKNSARIVIAFDLATHPCRCNVAAFDLATPPNYYSAIAADRVRRNLRSSSGQPIRPSSPLHTLESEAWIPTRLPHRRSQ
jgi:hypothetical protein